MAPLDILSRPQPTDVPKVRVAYGSEPNQFGDLWLPPKPKAASRKPTGLFPVVMNIHGGFWRNRYDLLHASHLCAALARAGVAVWNLEYRRVGDAGGAWPGTFEDITSGWRFLRQLAARHPLDLDRAAAMGHSAGGHLAVALAGHLPPQKPKQGTKPAADNGAPMLRGVIALAGVLDLQRAWELHLSNDAVVEFLGGTPEEMRDHYREADPMHLSVRCEQVLIHGNKDDTVPIEISRAYLKAKRARGERVRLEETPSGHFEVIDPETAEWKVVEKAVGAVVGVPSG